MGDHFRFFAGYVLPKASSGFSALVKGAMVLASLQMGRVLSAFDLHHVGFPFLGKNIACGNLFNRVARYLHFGVIVFSFICFLFSQYGCFARRGESARTEVLDDDSFFLPALEVSSAPASSFEIVFHPSSQPVRMLLVADWLDHRGARYYPSVHVQFRAWNDDTVSAWTALSTDDFVMSRDTIIVHVDRLLIEDARLRGANFTFRARFASAGTVTDWVKLPESIRFYDRDRAGIPRQPRELRLLP